jgi:alpha-L-rhamnosidase
MTTTGPMVSWIRLEYEETEFVPTARPRISWRVAADEPSWIQSRAKLKLARNGEVHIVEHRGSESVLVDWPFEALVAGESAELRVQVAGPAGRLGPWSEPHTLRAGFIEEGQWNAQFIELASPSSPRQPFLTRSEFFVREGLVSAVLFATAQGVYQAEVNGRAVDAQILKPGWTPYDFRLVHETTDVTNLLFSGQNAIGATVAGGWYTEVYGFRAGAAPVYGVQPAFAAQLELRYDDGSVDRVVTTAAWKTHDAPIISSGLYAGEHMDARAAVAGWSSPTLDTSAWQPALVRDVSVVPSARTSPSVTVKERLGVQKVIRQTEDSVLIDFGQNIVGRLQISVRGPAGHKVEMGHAEVLENGELSTRPLRRATSVDSYILAGDGEEVWQPQFTFHGFRFAELRNWPGDFDPSHVTAEVIYSDMPRTGWFESSNELLNRFHESVVWGTKGNFLYLPMDCPQRDERLGWTGDIQVFAPTASFLFDSDGFLASWMQDLAIEQRAIGGVPFIVPNVLDSARLPAAAWGDAATIVPWTLYERFGDLGVLRAQFASMQAWVEQVLELAGPRRLWEGNFQFGDWLDPSAPIDRPADGKTDSDLVASAYLYRSTSILARTAALLGDAKLAQHYERIAGEVKAAWQHEYLTASGRVMSDSQTAYAVALEFDLLPAEHRDVAGSRLAELVRKAGYRIQTGFVGTPLVQDALTSTGHDYAAARLMTQTEMPSWLYPITMGATTVWERWNSMLPDGSVNPGEMTSFNHYAFGAVADWLHRVLAGLAPASPGYKTLHVEPRPMPGFDHARASHETPYGLASSGWRCLGAEIIVDVVVPPNVTAHVILPDGTTYDVGSGDHQWRVADQRKPIASHKEVTVNSPLSQIIDDDEAYREIWKAISTVDPAIADALKNTLPWVTTQTLATSTIDTPASVFEAITTALKNLNARRRG